MIKNKFLGLIIVLFFVSGCVKKNEKNASTINNPIVKKTNAGNLVADTIIYPVTIFNFDSSDEWNEFRLRKVQRKKFVDGIFEAIYSGDLKVYHYYSGVELTIDDIKLLELSTDFSRDRIEEIQFVETWHFSTETKKFNKQVHSIVLAYSIFNDDGERRGLKAAFRIKTDQQE